MPYTEESLKRVKEDQQELDIFNSYQRKHYKKPGTIAVLPCGTGFEYRHAETGPRGGTGKPKSLFPSPPAGGGGLWFTTTLGLPDLLGLDVENFAVLWHNFKIEEVTWFSWRGGDPSRTARPGLSGRQSRDTRSVVLGPKKKRSEGIASGRRRKKSSSL